MSRRTASPGSSPGLSTKQKTTLWRKLRKLDALCQRYKPIYHSFLLGIYIKEAEKNIKLFTKYDEQRRLVRQQLKSIAHHHSGHS